MRFSTLAGLAVSAGSASAVLQGFNTGAFFLDQSAKKQADFAYEFRRAQNLPNTSGWTSTRLYTMIQWGTANDVIEAIPAAIETKTSLLLGLWTSGGSQAIQNEVTALKAAISQYGTAFTDLVVGISVGSEDLYRDSKPEEVGIGPATLIDCISQVRNAIAGTSLEGKPIGHVDTYDSFLNGTNSAVIDAIDWLGFDGYPYWEAENANSIGDAHERFWEGYNKTLALSKGKPVWVTETGWPVSGPNQNAAVASAENAQIYWQDIACELIAKNINIYWYTLQESQNGNAAIDFGLFPAGDLFQVEPFFNLAC